jgi:carboxyl-terminal processing protease
MINPIRKFRLLTLIIIILLGGLILPPGHSGAFFGDDAEPNYPLSQGRLITHALQAIASNYLEPNRIDPEQMFKESLEYMERLIPEFLVKMNGTRSMDVTVGVATKKFRIGKVSSLNDLRRGLMNILAFVDLHYSGDTKKSKIEYAALEGMMSALDPHSSFLPPKVYKEFRVGTKGAFGGLGIVISIKDGELTVISPLEGTPAWRTGIKAGDKIIQIGDESTINMSLTDAVNKLRGKVNTKVRVTISRPGTPAPFPVTLTRAVISIDSVQSTMLKEGQKRIGYIKLKSFQSNSDDDFTAALDKFQSGGRIDGLIVDMRNNPGGLLNQAIDIADHFMAKGTIVTTVASRGILMDKEVARPRDLQPDYPMIVLINEGSASASEIVAGALKVHDRALVMGFDSFGKGSVQTIFEIGEDSALKLTIAKYLPAGTMSIQSVGVTPDVELIPKTVDRKWVDLVENVIPNEEDLEQHLENEKKSKEKPAFRVGYYKPFEEAEEDPTKRVREYSKIPDVSEDFTVQLAKKLLARVTSSSRKKMLKEIAVPLSNAEKEQNKIIEEKLALLGIDWSPLQKQKSSELQVAYNLWKGSNRIKMAKAGTEVELELVAKNIGKGTFGQLLAVGQSEIPLLKNREFVYGKLKPGEKRSWRIPLEIPESIPSQDLTMDVEFHEQAGDIPTMLGVIIPIEGTRPPRFGYSYRLRESAKGRNLATGRTLNLEVTAYNLGKGASSEETVMLLSNKSGKKLFIERGRASLGTLAPGAARKETFKFHVSKDFSEPRMELELSIVDPKRLVALNKEFGIDVKGGKLIPSSGQRYQPPSIVLANPARSTDDDTYVIKGVIKDTDPIRDFYIFVRDKKVAYVPNAQETKEMIIKTSLPLEDGRNAVSIAARDIYELTGRTVFVIQRTEENTVSQQ